MFPPDSDLLKKACTYEKRWMLDIITKDMKKEIKEEEKEKLVKKVAKKVAKKERPVVKKDNPYA
jgi:hypothetical protein